ncbi:MAG: hypothetical protein ACREL2_04530, partial [Gemmatimonadales bacterium]
MLLTVTLAVGRAEAQSGATVAALERFRDSIGAVADTASLRRLQHHLDRAHDTSTVGLLRRGILALRLGSLPDIQRAGDRCAAAERQAPAWPYPPFCRGLAKEAFGSATAANHLNLGLMAGQGDLRRAADQYLVAIQRDPDFAPAIFALGQLVLRWRGVERQAEALSALRA